MPKIDLASIPGLDTAKALYGTAHPQGATYNDTITSIMVYVYDVTNGCTAADPA